MKMYKDAFPIKFYEMAKSIFLKRKSLGDEESLENEVGDILFFTGATKSYHHFIPMFIFFALFHNKNSKFEFIVDSISETLKHHKESFNWLKKNMNCGIVLREKNECNYVDILSNDNSLRFIMEPKQKAEYVYLCDIYIVEDILKQKIHIDRLNSAAYSNVVRKNSKRLTGLHLTKYNHFYPIRESGLSSRIKENKNDEALLYSIVEERGDIVEECYSQVRPTHGIHCSLNRFQFLSPKTSLGWGITYNRCLAYEEIFSSNQFKEFFKSLSRVSAGTIISLMMVTRGVINYSEREFSDLISVTKGKSVLRENKE